MQYGQSIDEGNRSQADIPRLLGMYSFCLIKYIRYVVLGRKEI